MYSKSHFLVLSLSLGLSGCVLRPETIKDRFVGEFKCSRDRITVEQPDKNRPDFYRATGCNRRASYQCSGDYGEFCDRIGSPETINPEGGALPSIPSPEARPAPSTPAPAPAPAPEPPKDKPVAAPPAP